MKDAVDKRDDFTRKKKKRKKEKSKSGKPEDL